MTVSIKQSLNKPIIKSYSVPAFYLGKRSEQMQISMSHMNSRSDWYLILKKTDAVLLIQQNSAKGRFLFFYMYLQRMFNFTNYDRKGKRNLPATTKFSTIF